MINSIDFVHIGYHKTGTTYMQNCGFGDKSEIGLLGGNSSENDENRKNLYLLKNQLSELDNESFDADEWREKFFFFTNKLEDLKGKVIGISDEELSGNYITGKDDFKIADRIYNVFGKVKIIIIIRNQLDMFDSIYRQYVHLGGNYSFKKFVRLECQSHVNIINKLKYDRLINRYIEVFGKDNVLVIPYEKMSNKNLFLTDIYKFIKLKDIEIPVSQNSIHNKSHHYYTLFFDRLINFLFRDDLSKPLLSSWFFKQYIYLPVYKKQKGFSFKKGRIRWWYRRIFIEKIIDPYIMYRLFVNHKTVDKKTQTLITSEFVDSNKKIEHMFGLNLEELGYPVK
jgi:hypothetical protein